MKKRRWFFSLLATAFVLWGGVRWANSASRAIHTLGVSDGRLAACPNRPNCVSSQAESPEHQAAAIPLKQPSEEALDKIESAIRSMKRGKIVTREKGYLHAEFCSRLLAFVDDVEFMIDDAERLIHFRSAARVGYSDMGANRRRMEEIRRRYEES